MRSFTYHIFLLPVFFVLHITNETFGLFPANLTIRFLFYYLILSLALFLIGKLIFKSTLKAGLWTTLALIIFFFFGAAHDLLKSYLPMVLTSYKVILPFLAIGFLLLTIYIKKKKTQFNRINKFFNLLFGLFALVEIALILFKSFTLETKKTQYAYVNRPQISIIDTNTLKPDNFFIVFDEYASSESLSQYLNFDNGSFDSSLLSHGFYIAKKSLSNYNLTPLSIASTLNFSYVDLPLEGETATSLVTMKASQQAGYAEIVKLLTANGYQFKNFGVFDIEGYKARDFPLFQDTPAKFFYLRTLAGRVYHEIGWNIPFLSSKSTAQEITKPQVEINMANLASFKEELKAESSAPKFVYGHVLMPHTPYYFDRNGNPLDNPSYETNTKKSDSLYRDQLIYTNKLILEMISNLKQDTKRPRVFIIEGDHGYRDTNPNSPRAKQFMNLNAWYFSDKDYAALYESISPVNSFRVVLNKYFNTDLPMLKDSTIDLNH